MTRTRIFEGLRSRARSVCRTMRCLPGRPAGQSHLGFTWMVALAGLLGAVAPSAAQANDQQAITSVALRADEHITLDGSLSHPAWQRAPVFHQFVEKAPATGGQPRHETRVRVLFNDQALYVGVEALDPAPDQIRAPLVRQIGRAHV